MIALQPYLLSCADHARITHRRSVHATGIQPCDHTVNMKEEEEKNNQQTHHSCLHHPVPTTRSYKLSFQI